ncbi:hypothetical protein ACNKHW_12195 [Shigella flexneri]
MPAMLEGRIQRRIEAIRRLLLVGVIFTPRLWRSLDFASKEQTEDSIRPNGDGNLGGALRSRQL